MPINIKRTRVCSTKLPASSRQAGGKARRRQICRKQTLRTALQFPEGTHPQKLTAQVAFVIYSLSSPSPLVTKSFCLSFSEGRVSQREETNQAIKEGAEGAVSKSTGQRPVFLTGRNHSLQLPGLPPMARFMKRKGERTNEEKRGKHLS